MPLYEYRCKSCGDEFEELVPLSAKSSPPCPKCSSLQTDKKMSRFGGGSGSQAGGSCGNSGFS